MQSIVTQLPLYPETEYVYSATFGSSEVVLEYFFNPRDKSWHLDISTSDFNYIARGLKLLPGVIHGADFDMSYLGLRGYLTLVPVTDTLKYEDIDPSAIYQYYKFYYVEAI